MTIHTAKVVTAPVRAPRAQPAAGAAFTASWPAVAAWSAGLVEAALGAGAIVSPAASIAGSLVGALLVSLGLATFGWGAFVLARGEILAPRAALTGTVAGIAVVAALLAVAPAHTSIVGVAAALLLLVILAAFCAAATRRRRSPRAASVWGLLLAAAVAAVVVTPALGATQSAVLIRDDGTVPVVTHDGH